MVVGVNDFNSVVGPFASFLPICTHWRTNDRNTDNHLSFPASIPSGLVSVGASSPSLEGSKGG